MRDAPPLDHRTGVGVAGDALRREAAILAHCRHPGVVELVSATTAGERVTVTTVAAPGTALDVAVLSIEELAGVSAVLATTVADLHDIGVAHGDLAAHRVILDAAGRPILHGFADARWLDGAPWRWPDHALARVDDRVLAEVVAAALTRCVSGTGEAYVPPPPRHSRRRDMGHRTAEAALRSWVASAVAGTTSARQFAEALAGEVPGSRLPTRSPRLWSAPSGADAFGGAPGPGGGDGTGLVPGPGGGGGPLVAAGSGIALVAGHNHRMPGASGPSRVDIRAPAPAPSGRGTLRHAWPRRTATPRRTRPSRAAWPMVLIPLAIGGGALMRAARAPQRAEILSPTPQTTAIGGDPSSGVAPVGPARRGHSTVPGPAGRPPGTDRSSVRAPGAPIQTTSPTQTALTQAPLPPTTAGPAVIRSATSSAEVSPTAGSMSPTPTAPFSYASGVLTVGPDRFALGRAGDVVATGRWSCRSEPAIALLRPGTGEVWLFDGWPGGAAPIEAIPLTTVPGGTTVTARREGSCDALAIGRTDGGTVVIRAWEHEGAP